MTLFRAKLQLLIFVTLVTLIAFYYNNPPSHHSPESTSEERLTAITPERRDPVLDFNDVSSRIMENSLSRIQLLKALETGEFEISGRKTLREWLSLSRGARREIQNDLASLRAYSLAGLGDHVAAKELLIHLLSVELNLWVWYDRFAKMKLEPGKPGEMEHIEKKLSSGLILYRQAADSLKCFYRRKDQEPQGWRTAESPRPNVS